VTLTARQRQALQLYAEGHTYTEIARRMDLTVASVKTHLTRARHRLDAISSANAVFLADQAGLLRKPAAPKPAPTSCTCPGDRAAYRRHRRRGETACLASRRANATATQQYRETRSAA